MNLSSLNSASLRSVLKFAEKRERLAAEIAKIDEQISKVLGQGNGSSGVGRKIGKSPRIQAARKAVKRAKRGAVKEMILAGLKEAGEKGTAVKDLATKLGIKAQNIHVWLHTTGKKTGLIEAAGKGIYRLKQSDSVEPPSNSPKTSKPEAAKVVKNAPKKARKKK